MTIYFFGVKSIPYKVRSESIPLIFLSICIIAYGIHISHIRLTVAAAAGYWFWLIIMTVLFYDMEVILRLVSLYVVSMARMEQLEVAGLDLCMKLPGIAFYGVYKVVFYLVLPYGIMATLPVQSIIGEMDVLMAVYGIGIVVLFSVITAAIWKQGLKHYNSASS